MLTLIIFLVILGLLVFVHELGHFVMAKRAGMQVEEFGFGFPPRLFGFKRNETIYSVNWIPLGGFVKISGEDGDDPSNPSAFSNKGFWARFSTLIAGVTMNVVFAWILISIALGVGLPTVVDEGQNLPASAKISDSTVAFRSIADQSPAQAAGFKVGDAVVEAAGVRIDSVEQLQKVTLENAGKETKYKIRRGDSVLEKNLTPRQNPPEGQGPLGVGLATIARVSYPWHEVLYRGLGATYNTLVFTVTSFAEIIGRWIGGESVGDALSGPVGIAVITRDMAELGFIYLLQFTAILSINLAVINSIPFPALDGGRILFLIIEKLRGRKLPQAAEQWANTAGFALLLLLMVFITVKDVGRFDVFDRIKNLLT